MDPVLSLLTLFFVWQVLRFVLQLAWAVLRTVAFLVVMVIGLALLSHTSKDKTPNDNAGVPKQGQSFEREVPRRTAIDPCSDLASFPEGAGSAGELCDRYYKSGQCLSEIESKFQKWQLQIAPAVACGSPLRKPAADALGIQGVADRPSESAENATGTATEGGADAARSLGQ